MKKNNSQQIKNDRFKRVASRRVQEILKKMQLLRNCSNLNNYEYTADQIDKIISAVDLEWKKVKNEFQNNLTDDERFEL